MYLKNLSEALLKICEYENLSYEKLAEICDVSPRYIGRIIRKKSAPTINTLEKICIGLNKTPDELLCGIQIKELQ